MEDRFAEDEGREGIKDRRLEVEKFRRLAKKDQKTYAPNLSRLPCLPNEIWGCIYFIGVKPGVYVYLGLNRFCPCLTGTNLTLLTLLTHLTNPIYPVKPFLPLFNRDAPNDLNELNETNEHVHRPKGRCLLSASIRECPRLNKKNVFPWLKKNKSATAPHRHTHTGN